VIARLILPLYAFGALAFAGTPNPVPLLWPQVAFVPPGTNATVRTDVIGGVVVGTGAAGAAQGGAAGPGPGGAGASVGVPVGSAPGGGGPGAGGGATSSTTGNGTAGSAGPATGAALDMPVCTATVAAGEYPVSAFGGIVEIRVQVKPAGCKPTLGSSGSWVLLAAGAQGGDVYRFSVSPNISNTPRRGVVVIGTQKILIEQSASAGARFAASPGHITLSVTSDRAPSPRAITIFSDDKSLTYNATSSQPWLRVTPAKGSAPGAQRLQIAVDPARLRPGRNEGFIRVSATGQLSAPLNVPVVVEVPRVR
jgi:hypothetical protein